MQFQARSIQITMRLSTWLRLLVYFTQELARCCGVRYWVWTSSMSWKRSKGFKSELTPAANILRGKYTDQSSNWNVDHLSSKAVDGSLTTGYSSTSTSTPYVPIWWQADLLGFYRIDTISVRPPTGYGPSLNVGVSTIHVRCNNSQVVVCGAWPTNLNSEVTRSFSCPLQTPVRFIRIWKNTNDNVRLIEVEATGARAVPSALQYDLEYTGRKYTYPGRTLNVSVVNECATVCFYTPYCAGFSFLEGARDNCLIVVSCRNWVSEVNWKLYKVDDQPSFCEEK